MRLSPKPGSEAGVRTLDHRPHIPLDAAYFVHRLLQHSNFRPWLKPARLEQQSCRVIIPADEDEYDGVRQNSTYTAPSEWFLFYIYTVPSTAPSTAPSDGNRCSPVAAATLVHRPSFFSRLNASREHGIVKQSTRIFLRQYLDGALVLNS